MSWWPCARGRRSPPGKRFGALAQAASPGQATLLRRKEDTEACGGASFLPKMRRRKAPARAPRAAQSKTTVCGTVSACAAGPTQGLGYRYEGLFLLGTSAGGWEPQSLKGSRGRLEVLPNKRPSASPVNCCSSIAREGPPVQGSALEHC